jgi:hypothetical protein
MKPAPGKQRGRAVQLREDLGEAIGRPLSVGDMAKLCGLPPETGPATIAKWEAGAGPHGSVAALWSFSLPSGRGDIQRARC